MIQSPFTRFGLFRNPFGELTTDERARLAVVDVRPYIEWLSGSGRRALQVLAPCGHGKSTHLWAIQHAWAGRAVTSHYVYFPEEGQQPALPPEGPLLIDEAQRLRWWRRRQLLRHPGPLVLASHSDLSASLISAGFQIEQVNLARRISPVRLQELLNRRILASAVQAQRNSWHPLCLSLAQVVALQERFGSNIRHIEHYLYATFQRFAEKGDPWLPAN